VNLVRTLLECGFQANRRVASEGFLEIFSALTASLRVRGEISLRLRTKRSAGQPASGGIVHSIHPSYPSSPGSTLPRNALFVLHFWFTPTSRGALPPLAGCLPTPTLSFLADESCDFAVVRALRGSGERSLRIVRRPVIGAEPDKESRTSTLSG
jgi:hypothetical protein